MSASTKKALADSTKKLLSKKTLDRITVKDITDDCKVNRQTFYYHFHDIYDVVEWILTEDVKQFEEGLDGDNWKEVFTKMMHHMSEDKSSYVNMFYSLDKRQIDQLIYKVSKPIIYGVAKRAVNGRAVSAEDLEYVSNFFTYAMAGLITEWIFGGMNMDNVDKELSKQFTIMDGIMEFTINKFVQ